MLALLVDCDLVLENYGGGHAWLRPETPALTDADSSAVSTALATRTCDAAAGNAGQPAARVSLSFVCDGVALVRVFPYQPLEHLD